MGTTEIAKPRDFYVWEPAGKGISIHLSYDVVDRLLQESMQGLGAVPRRGVEVGGVLLGAVESEQPRVIRIDDFESVQCEYASGPSYVFSDNDKARLEAALRQHRRTPERLTYAVGFYRSHTRKDLFLADSDLALCSQYFANPSDVVLVIRPFVTRTSLAGFFFWEGGKIAPESSSLEFPFNRKDLGGGDAPARTRRRNRVEQAPDETPRPAIPEPAGREQSTPYVMPPPLRRRMNLWMWTILAVIFLMLGGLVGFVAAPYLRERMRAPVSGDPYALGLAVTSDGDHIHIKWNRQAPAILAARGGRMTITDNGSVRKLDLDLPQLKNGTVIYRKISKQVKVRMEVFAGSQGAITENVEVTGGKVEPTHQRD